MILLLLSGKMRQNVSVAYRQAWGPRTPLTLPGATSTWVSPSLPTPGCPTMYFHADKMGVKRNSFGNNKVFTKKHVQPEGKDL
jgi:hypothetical protein